MLLRGQGTYVSDEEISAVMDCCGTTEQQFVKELVQLKAADPAAASGEKGNKLPDRDELYHAAIDVIVREGRGSVSLLQRALGIGYGRAARLVDYMAEDGIVGQYNGSQAREVMITLEQWAEMSGQGGGGPAVDPPPKSGRVLTMAPRSERRIEDDEEDEDDEVPFDDDEEEADDESDTDDAFDEEGGDEAQEQKRFRRGRESA
jgi:S-DNA-T family DNA segregation ATPase FtsK/SpoIIIE